MKGRPFNEGCQLTRFNVRSERLTPGGMLRLLAALLPAAAAFKALALQERRAETEGPREGAEGRWLQAPHAISIQSKGASRHCGISEGGLW